MIGPGKYDDIATEILARTDADGMILIVLGGNRGHGSSIKMTPEMAHGMPDFLRAVADDLEHDLKKVKPEDARPLGEH